jgi:hypothetical protein
MSALDEIKAALAKLDQAKREYRSEEARIIEKYHPLQVGDIIACNGHSHTGKLFCVKSRGFSANRGWLAFGPILKKDGSESFNAGEWRQWRQEITE